MFGNIRQLRGIGNLRIFFNNPCSFLSPLETCRNNLFGRRTVHFFGTVFIGKRVGGHIPAFKQMRRTNTLLNDLQLMPQALQRNGNRFVPDNKSIIFLNNAKRFTQAVEIRVKNTIYGAQCTDSRYLRFSVIISGLE